jgi:hypothetical protein
VIYLRRTNMGREIHAHAANSATASSTASATLTIPPETHANVERLAKAMGVEKAEVFSRALALLDVAVDAKAHGNAIGIVDSEGHLVNEISGY